MWVGGNDFRTTTSQPMLLDTKYPNKYVMQGGEHFVVVIEGSQYEVNNITLTNSSITWSSKAENYAYVTGIVGIKLR